MNLENISSKHLHDLIEQIDLENARESFADYIKMTFPEYVFNWHHQHLIKVLEAFCFGEIKKVMVFMPPQHGKSEIVSRRLPSFLLGLDPDLRIAACSYSADLAHKFNRSVQRIIDDEIYTKLFPATNLNSKRVSLSTGSYVRNTTEFEIVGKKGGYKAIGVGGPLTGNSVDIGIIDDPVKDALEAGSTTFRNRLWDWYNEVFMTRMHNDSQVLLTMTRWHEDDLAGRILAIEDDWHIVTFPAIKENEDNTDDPRDVGDALWPERHGLEKLMAAKRNSPRAWASLYQQRPSPLKGEIILAEWFDIIPAKYGLKRYYLDSSYTTNKSNDPSCLMEYIYDGHDITITNVWRVWLDFPSLCAKIKDIVTDQSSVLTIEPKASGKSIAQYLSANCSFIVREDKAPKDSKVARCNAVTPFMERGLVKLTEGVWNDPFLDECKVFPNGLHDDQVDCLTAILRLHLLSGYSDSNWTGHNY